MYRHDPASLGQLSHADLVGLVLDLLDRVKVVEVENAALMREIRARGKPICDDLTWLLRDRNLSDPDNQRLLDGIGSQHDRDRVLFLLKHPEIEPTNNRAERGLRPAVIARKVSHCSKNERGARIHEAMKSVTATLALRRECVASGLANLIQGRPMPAPAGR